MVNLQAVAQKAGVSTATVSKVLANKPYFTEATRQKVMQAVEELGYVPNLAARALSSGKTHIIGVIFPLIHDALFADPLTLHILEGVEAECSARGYNLLLSTPRLTDSGFDDTFQRLILSRYLDGVVALDNIPAASVLTPIQARDLPAVSIGYHPHAYRIRSQDDMGGYQLMAHILDLGHRHIGLISVPDDLNLAIGERLRGMERAASEHGIAFERLPLVYGNFSMQSGEACAADLLERHPHLTALICLNDRMAMGAIQAVRGRGLHIPQDVSVVGYDDIPGAAYFDPPLTTIDQQAPEVGRVAVRALFALLNDQQPISEEIPTRLVIRQSSAAPILSSASESQGGTWQNEQPKR